MKDFKHADSSAYADRELTPFERGVIDGAFNAAHIAAERVLRSGGMPAICIDNESLWPVEIKDARNEIAEMLSNHVIHFGGIKSRPDRENQSGNLIVEDVRIMLENYTLHDAHVDKLSAKYRKQVFCNMLCCAAAAFMDGSACDIDAVRNFELAVCRDFSF